MIKYDIQIRPAKREDIEAIFPGADWRFGGYVWCAEYEGEAVAVAGVVDFGLRYLAFSGVKEDFSAPKRAMWIGAKLLWERIVSVAGRGPIQVVGDKETSPVLLKKLGFKRIEGNEWLWAIR